MRNNGFKLLAIRPLEGTSSEILKGLKINCIYRFYNEYEFIINKATNEIVNIKYTPTVPANLYGQNINISAIVGQNGSGKSSLMELFYYATLLCNKEHVEDKFEHNFNAEVILFKADFIQIIKVTNEKAEKKIFIRNEKGEYVNNKSSNEVDFYFYTNVLNYSIYGLNSNFIPWIGTIFYKNDAYQLPIVINPFKEYGNYDINREYLLMQSRAVFFTYVLGFKEIIKDIYIDTIHFEIDINKIIEVNKELSTYDLLVKFFDVTVTENEFNRTIFDKKSLSNIVSLGDIRNFDLDKKNSNQLCKDVYSTKIKEASFYKAITYLYIFKKLFKISKTYKKYKKYLFLFSDKLHFDFNFQSASQAIKVNIEPNLPDLDNKQIIYEQIMLYLDLKTDAYDLTEDDLFNIKEMFMSYYRVDHSKPNKIDNHLNSINYNSNNVLNNVEPIRKLIQSLFNGQEFRQHLFKNYIQELQKDTSHITFKLKQAINYFKLDIFKRIELNKSSILKKDNNCKINVSIHKEYFKNRKQIQDIPLAVFNHIIQVVKTEEKDETKRTELIQKGELKPYSYTSLSSGEQHLMNSILTIAYHNYNLLSVSEGNGLKKYRNINLIFDELELYLHPEYQRVYINNLINVLNKIQNITKQKDICYNILMVTHSPFILSDIPSQNILKLENGEPKSNDGINSFAANIYDLLNDEFFLKNGAVGAYAQNYINTIIFKIKKINPDTDKKIINELKSKIAIIGDELIRYGLVEHLFEKLKSPEFEIELLKERIKILEAKNVNDEKN